MKKYRSLVVIAVVVMFVFSVYNLISTAAEQSAQVKGLLKEAQTLSEQGLIAKAVEKYSEVIEIDPAEKYYSTIIDLYYNAGEVDNSIAWGVKAIDVFPNAVSGYEKLLRAYIDSQRYQKAYETLETVDGRGLGSKTIEGYRSQIQYRFYLEYVGIKDAKQPSGGHVAVYQKEKWGAMTTQGSTALKSNYQYVGAFANGMVPVCDLEGIWYFADTEGQYAKNISYGISGEITDVGIYNDELFPVCVDGVYKYYDLQFNHCFGEYDYAGAFNYGVAAVKSGNVWTLIDTKGKPISKESFEDVLLDSRGVCCIQEVAVVKNNGKYHLIDKTGKTIGKEGFDAAKPASNGELIAVKKGAKWGFADLSGKIVIEPQYDDALSFSNGLGAVQVNGAWGYINENNDLVIDAEYITCLNMQSDGTAMVNTDRGWNILKLYSKNY